MKRLALTAFLLPFPLLAQGPLPPPAGPPVASMKTLDQVEARIPVTEDTAPGNFDAVHVITTPGSYYLTGDVQAFNGMEGILIEASNVTIDLNGYSLKGAVGSLNGIGISKSNTPLANLTVRNGFITDFEERGIYTIGLGAIQGLTVEDLTISCTGVGIMTDVTGSTVVRRVFVRGGSGGIQCVAPSSIQDCVVSGTTGSGISGDVVERCQVSHVTSAASSCISGSRISHCSVATVSGTSSLNGIFGDEVDHCVVNGLTCSGTGFIDGVKADLVTGTRVLNLTSAGGNVRGIAQRNTSQGIVTGCSVASLKTTGTGAVTGIDADSVSNSQLSRIGFEGSTGTVSGILFETRADDCSLNSVGHAGVTGAVRGIDNSSLVGSVNRVTLRDFKGAGVVSGVRAGLVERATVSKFNQNGSGAIVNQAILAQTVSHCLASELVANTGVSTYAISADSVTDSRVEGVSNNGGGTANGISGSQIVNCTAADLDGIGISGNTNATRISGCSVRNAAITGIEYSGVGGLVENNTVRDGATGIQTTASSSHAVVRGNQVSFSTQRYSMNPNSVVGPFITTTGPITSTNPFANFYD